MRIQFTTLKDNTSTKYVIASVIDEKSPIKLAKVVEGISQFYGYPISNHINTVEKSWKFMSPLTKIEKDRLLDVYKSSKALAND
jgi:hypothetical protein